MEEVKPKVGDKVQYVAMGYSLIGYVLMEKKRLFRKPKYLITYSVDTEGKTRSNHTTWVNYENIIYILIDPPKKTKKK